MGLLDKVKNMFTEEVEVEEVKPIKKEVIQVEIPAPETKERKEAREMPEVKPVSDSTALNREEKFVFPVYFDDKDFDTLEKKEQAKPIKKEPIYQKPKEEKVEVKIFKPTPIISPVYGILDKNYHKEDITSKQKSEERVPSKSLTVDDVRNKAFGTLEDDLESTLFGKTSILFREADKPETDLFEDIEEDSKTEAINLDEVVKKTAKHAKKEDKSIEELLNDEVYSKKENFDVDPDIDPDQEIGGDSENESLNESDLFHLIDTMYEKGDKE